jgi:hypothetical protein
VLKKSIKYTDFNGEEQTEDFYFHLSKADLIGMEFSAHGEGGLQVHLQKIAEAEDGKQIWEFLESLVAKSYGMKSPDGKRFVKNDQLMENFKSTAAYSELIMELCLDAGKAAEFVNGIVPAGLAEDVARLQETPAVADQAVPASPEADPTAIEPHVLTQAEVLEMDSDELKSGLATGRYKLQ